jgi:hypothetical protein
MPPILKKKPSILKKKSLAAIAALPQCPVRPWHDNPFINASKTQVLFNSQRYRSDDVSSVVILRGDSVRLSDVVKNLKLYVDGRLSWRRQVSFSHLFYFASRDLGISLVRSVDCTYIFVHWWQHSAAWGFQTVQLTNNGPKIISLHPRTQNVTLKQKN